MTDQINTYLEPEYDPGTLTMKGQPLGPDARVRFLLDGASLEDSRQWLDANIVERPDGTKAVEIRCAGLGVSSALAIKPKITNAIEVEIVRG